MSEARQKQMGSYRKVRLLELAQLVPQIHDEAIRKRTQLTAENGPPGKEIWISEARYQKIIAATQKPAEDEEED